MEHRVPLYFKEMLADKLKLKWCQMMMCKIQNCLFAGELFWKYQMWSNNICNF